MIESGKISRIFFALIDSFVTKCLQINTFLKITGFLTWPATAVRGMRAAGAQRDVHRLRSANFQIAVSEKGCGPHREASVNVCHGTGT
jgi:hypothetical protein